MKIGNATVEITDVEIYAATVDSDIPGAWITGSIQVKGTTYVGGIACIHTATLPVGCWSDTDNDYTEWCADNEGARVIGTLLGIPDFGPDTRGSFVRTAFQSECEEIGLAVCAELRRGTER